MAYTPWITLPPEWKLQDVQAALNVIIAFLCAASVFVLVRHFWLLAARKVARQKDIPAHALLSLNTIGEAIDVIWLLRHEILTSRYRSLLFQCVFVLVLTLCTLASGWLARFSTRSVLTIVPRQVEGSLAMRDTFSLLYDILDISETFKALEKANFPQHKLAEFWPNPVSNWQYNNEQWNSSWHMECVYNESVPVPDTRIVTSDCTDGVWGQWPLIYNNWRDWKTEDSDYAYYTNDGITWSETKDTVKDVLLFAHGLEIPKYELRDNINVTSFMRMRTVAIHLQGVPRNSSFDDGLTSCEWSKGPIQAASYTSATCELKRDLDLRTGHDLDTWGASPDISSLDRVAAAYTQFYAGRMRRESAANAPLTPITGRELVTFYQAYQVVKDTAGTIYYNVTDKEKPKTVRTIDVQVRAAQVSMTCLIVCAVMTLTVLVGITNYWLFLLCNLKRLEKTPQSKLDWMLQTLKTENESPRTKARHKLRTSISSSDQLFSDITPLTKLDQDQHQQYRSKSLTSSITTREVIEPDEIIYSTPGSHSDFSQQVTPSPPSQPFWSPFQPSYHQAQGDYGLGISGRHGYSKITSPPGPYHYSSQWDTTYDPGRR
ncbi:hypothetical protein LTR64_004718 [Lithohypha guttulata]|uniref:uncharacterized protein n=1 Tax=Lithohypha guttulata TaxID=1690604 RepID=UPI002DE02E4A|nr:hypothetical protein LTR51_005984 [Lithohypha guttulata]